MGGGGGVVPDRPLKSKLPNYLQGPIPFKNEFTRDVTRGQSKGRGGALTPFPCSGVLRAR